MKKIGEKERTSSLWIIILTIIVDFIGIGIIIPLLPFYSKLFGATPIILGMLVAASSLMQFILSPVIGKMSDKIGRRPIIIGTLIISILGHVTFVFSNSIYILLISRLLAGAGASNISVAQAYIADSTEQKDRVKWLGRIGAAFGIGTIVGPLISGSLISYGFAFPGIVAAGIASINLILAFFWLSESITKKEKKQNQELKESIKLVFKNRTTKILLATFFIGNFSFFTIPVIYPLIGIEYFDLDAKLMSIIFVYIGITQATIQGLMGRITKRIKDEKLLAIGILLMVGILIIPIFTNFIIFLILTGIISIGIGIMMTIVPSIISKKSSRDEQGSILGISQSIASLARVPGPFMGGLLYERVGSSSPFTLSGILMIIALMMGLLLVRETE